MDVIPLRGVHHLKLPVRDIERTEAWYQRVLGYRRAAEFIENDVVMGIAMVHPVGGPELAFHLDPERAQAAAGFDYFAIGVPDEATMHTLAARLDELGEQHGGVHHAMRGWILPYLHDPDGHEVRFYTIEAHTSYEADRAIRDDDAPQILGRAKRAAGSSDERRDLA
jgi:catechol 2,3-dioxygenase-like lactoylglutathione lyase family enzyme